MKDKYSDESVQLVLKTVTEIMEISIEQLSDQSLRGYPKKVSIGFCSYFLWREFQYPYSFIAEKLPFRLCEESMRSYSQLIQKAKLDKPKSEIDKFISDYFFKINELIKTHKKSKLNTNEKQSTQLAQYD